MLRPPLSPDRPARDGMSPDLTTPTSATSVLRSSRSARNKMPGSRAVAELCEEDLRFAIYQEVARALSDACAAEKQAAVAPHAATPRRARSVAKQPCPSRLSGYCRSSAPPREDANFDLNATPSPRGARPTAGVEAGEAPSAPATAAKQKPPHEVLALIQGGSGEGPARKRTMESIFQAEEVPRWSEQVMTRAPWCCESLLSRLQDFGTRHPRTPSDAISKFAVSSAYSKFIGIMVVLHCVLITMGFNSQLGEVARPLWLIVLEYVLAFLWVVDVFVTMWHQRLAFFDGVHWIQNWLDLFLALSGVLSLLEERFRGPQGFRILRVLKIIKAFSALRALTLFSPLRLLFLSVVRIQSTLVASFAMVGLVVYMSALIITSGVIGCIQTAGCDYDGLLQSFGSVELAFVSLLRTLFDGWGDYYDSLQPAGWFYQAWLVIIVLFTDLALMNIILGFCVDKAIEVLGGDPEEKARKAASHESEIRCILKSTILRHSGGTLTLDRKSWNQAQDDVGTLQYLNMNGLRPRDAGHLFDILERESSDGSVNVNDFVSACVNTKGSPSCVDFLELRNCLPEELRVIQEATTIVEP